MYLWHFMELFTCRNKKVYLLTSVSDDSLGSLHLHCRSSILPAGPGALAAVDEGRGKTIQQVLLNDRCMQSCSLYTSGWATHKLPYNGEKEQKSVVLLAHSHTDSQNDGI